MKKSQEKTEDKVEPRVVVRAYRVDSHNTFTGADAKFLERVGGLMYHEALDIFGISEEYSRNRYEDYSRHGFKALEYSMSSKKANLEVMPKVVDVVLDYSWRNRTKRSEFVLPLQNGSEEELRVIDILLRRFKPDHVFNGEEAANIYKFHDEFFHVTVPKVDHERVKVIAPNLPKFLEELVAEVTFRELWTSDGTKPFTMPKTILLSYGYLASDKFP